MHMRLEQLEYLRTVAKTKSINKASEQLYVSHQAISTALQGLEKELNTQLYTRTNKGVQLTPDGIYVLTAAKQIFEIINDLNNHFRPKTSILPCSFSIGATAAIYEQSLTDALIQYYKTYSSIPLNLITGHGRKIIQQVADRSIDLGLICHSVYNCRTITSPIPETIQFIPLLSFQYTMVCSPASRFAHLDTVSVHQVLEYPVIFAEDMTPENLTEYPPYQVLQYFNDVTLFPETIIPALTSIVEQDFAVSIAATNYSLKQADSNNTLLFKPIKELTQNYIGVILHNDAIHNPLIHFFLNLLYQKSNFELPEWFPD